MKPLFATALMIVAAGHLAPVSARAQTATTSSTIKPKPVTTVPVRPPLQTAADTAKDMAHEDRLSIQSDLAWVGFYNGAVNGDVNDRMVSAIKAFQKDHGAPKQTGVLNPKERETLSDAARKLQDYVGWKIVNDPVSGARIGVPTKLVPQVTSDANGTKWSSTTGTIQIELARRKEAKATAATVARQEMKANARKTDYNVIKPDFFVLSGSQGLKKFYIRGQTRENEVRIMTVLYDQATEGTMIPVSVAMSSAFNPFPGGSTAQSGGAARKKVEYSTGIVVNANGTILADRQATESCSAIVVTGYGNAERVADDETRELALLRIYGANGLKPLAMAASAVGKQTAFMIGISDPQNQGGRAAVTSIAANSTDGTLTPEPGLGFSGAAALDSDGRFTGMTRLKVAVVAGPAATAATSQAILVSADEVREFLKSNAVLPTTAASDAKSSVLRVICVRK